MRSATALYAVLILIAFARQPLRADGPYIPAANHVLGEAYDPARDSTNGTVFVYRGPSPTVRQVGLAVSVSSVDQSSEDSVLESLQASAHWSIYSANFSGSQTETSSSDFSDTLVRIYIYATYNPKSFVPSRDTFEPSARTWNHNHDLADWVDQYGPYVLTKEIDYACLEIDAESTEANSYATHALAASLEANVSGILASGHVQAQYQSDLDSAIHDHRITLTMKATGAGFNKWNPPSGANVKNAGSFDELATDIYNVAGDLFDKVEANPSPITPAPLAFILEPATNVDLCGGGSLAELGLMDFDTKIHHLYSLSREIDELNNIAAGKLSYATLPQARARDMADQASRYKRDLLNSVKQRGNTQMTPLPGDEETKIVAFIEQTRAVLPHFTFELWRSGANDRGPSDECSLTVQAANTKFSMLTFDWHPNKLDLEQAELALAKDHEAHPWTVESIQSLVKYWGDYGPKFNGSSVALSSWDQRGPLAWRAYNQRDRAPAWFVTSRMPIYLMHDNTELDIYLQTLDSRVEEKVLVNWQRPGEAYPDNYMDIDRIVEAARKSANE